MTSVRIPLLALTLAALAGQAVAADPTVYQSASFVDYGANEPGGYFLDDTRSIGAAFQITRGTDVSTIGGYFSQYSADAIFGAIVPLATLSSLPSGSIDGIALAHVVFTPTGTDQSAALSVHLDPGTYAVVFGSGLWGATGTSALVSGQDGSGATLFSGAGSDWVSMSDTDIRLTVNGSVAAVPEPAEWTLLFAGLGCLGLALQRRRR